MSEHSTLTANSKQIFSVLDVYFYTEWSFIVNVKLVLWLISHGNVFNVTVSFGSVM